MKIELYGSNNCSKCKTLHSGLSKIGINHAFLDADADEFQDFLDSMSVEKLPFVCIIDDSSKIVWSASGDVNLTEIIREIKRAARSSSKS